MFQKVVPELGMPRVDEELCGLGILNVDLEALSPAKPLLGSADTRPSTVDFVDLEHHVEGLRVGLVRHLERAALDDLNNNNNIIKNPIRSDFLIKIELNLNKIILVSD